MSWVSLCELDQLPESQPRYAEVDGFQLAVIRQAEKVYVMDNYCPHAGGNLAAGYVEDGCAVCPMHHWAFGLEDGALRGNPGVTVRTYRARLLHREGQPTLVQADLPMY
jgi:nitrite reductase (NADH) small subunit